MEVRAIMGDPLFTVRFTAITAAAGIPSALLTLPVSGDNSRVSFFKFTSGGTNEPAVGETVTGLTSAATARIVGIALVSGTWAGGTATGVLFVDRVSGTFQAENLDHTNGATDDLTIAAAPQVLPCPGFHCRGVLMVVETADLRWVEDGSTVTATGGVNDGFIMGDGESREMTDPSKLKFINAVGGNNAVLVATLFY